MVGTWWHKLFSQGQSSAHGGYDWARVRQPLMHKPVLESLEDRTLPSLVAPVVYNTAQGPEGLAVGDLRGNGRLDIVTANTSAPSSVSVLLGNGDGTFRPAVDFATGGIGTQFVALGQLGRGGTLDIITANPGSGTVSVLLGNGDGTFKPAVQYGVGLHERPIAVAVGDFTGDGIPDLVTVNVPQAKDEGHNSFSLLVGKPNGTFQTAVTTLLPNGPSSLAAGDFTGNGILSIAVGTRGGVLVLLGNGNGTFQAPVFYAASPTSVVSSIAVSDLAGTGRLDLATANPGTDTVSVLLGNGNGTFAAATNYTVGGQGPLAVAAGRFRPGGPLDLVTDDVDSNSMSVLPGVGNGTFGTAAQYFAADVPFAVATGDFAGRGIDDIVVTNNSQGSSLMGAVSVLLNRGNGTFAPLPIQFNQPLVEGVATGDLRGNGVQDLVTANEAAGSVSVYLGNGDGTFGAPNTFQAGPGPLEVVVGDFNGDGHLDLVVTEASGSTFVDLLLGNGDGTFQAPIQIPVGAEALSIAVGHFHSPNILDLVTTDFQNNQVNVMLNNGRGNFRAPVSYAVGMDPLSVAVGSLRGNGITDLVVANADDNTVSVLLGNGDGTFQPAVNFSISNDPQVANFPRFVTVASLRSNGPLDIVTTNFGSSNVTVLLGKGDGTFGAPIHLNAGVGNDAAAIADFDNDGTPDILVTNFETDTVTLLPGNGHGTFRAPVQLATGTSPFAMAVGHFDGHNLPEVAVLGTSTISVLLNDSGGVAPAVAASANGVGQIVGAGLTPEDTRINTAAKPGLVGGDTVGAPQAFRAPNAAGGPAPEDTAAPLLMQDQLNALFVDQDFASGKPEPALSFAADRSLAQQGPEDPLGRTDAIDQLFTELT
jgi:hypothetical protein